MGTCRKQKPWKPAGTVQERGEEHWLAEHLPEREHHAERAFFRDSYGPKLQEMKRVGMLPPGIRQENRQRLDDQIRMAAGRLQLGGGTDGEDGRNAGGGAGKA